MLYITNKGIKDFRKSIRNKYLFLIGAGVVSLNCIEMYSEYTTIMGIMDNDSKKWNSTITFENIMIPIVNPTELERMVKKVGKEHVVFVISSYPYARELIEQLDDILEFDGIETYIQALMRNTKEETGIFEFSKGNIRIPKKIHYIWIGGKPIPKHLQYCIDSWKKYNPEYEIICWNENNYDFTKTAYMREAYEKEAWGFAPDYARLDIIHEHGGIYLDTDVEVLRPLDCLLKDRAFMGMGSVDRMNLGIGFGAEKHCEIIKDFRDYYENFHFVNSDGSLNRKPCCHYQHPVLKKYGFSIENEYQKIDDIVLYPAEVLSPKGTSGMGDFFSDNTLAIHHGEGSWYTDKEKEGVSLLKKYIESRISFL